MDLSAETAYKTPLSNSPLLLLLLTSLTRQKHSPDCSEKIYQEYDYIIVGAGAAGSVVAGRLSEKPCVTVLVLEAGPKAPLISEVPALSFNLIGTNVDWFFKSVPQKYAASGIKNEQVYMFSGKMLGGSGSINAMNYVRGNRKNYDDWAAQGAKGWSYNCVFPYFLRLEDNTNFHYLANGYHNAGGPITVEEPRYDSILKQAIYGAAKELGHEFVDSNGPRQTGFFDYQLNMRDGQRCSSLKGYLVPAEHRPNIDILANATVTKVIIEEGETKGVEFFYKGKMHTVKATKEVIVSAGAINTPKLLMLSGVGPREELKKWNIPVNADLPVGKNLQDHGNSPFYFTIDPCYKSKKDITDPSTILEYINYRTGLLTTFGPAYLAFLNGLNATSSVDFPNYQLYITESSKEYKNSTIWKPEVYEQFMEPIDDDRTVIVCSSQILQPKSKGTVTLHSTDPFDPPVIDPNYLEDPRDVEDIVDGLRMCKKLMNTEVLKSLGAKEFETLMPGCEIYAGSEEEYFRCFTRRIFHSTYHPVGTAKMGDPAELSTVVDPELRVKGIKGLRVVDASVMPIIPSANTNIPTIMVAEKASDIIKGSIMC